MTILSDDHKRYHAVTSDPLDVVLGDDTYFIRKTRAQFRLYDEIVLIYGHPENPVRAHLIVVAAKTFEEDGENAVVVRVLGTVPVPSAAETASPYLDIPDMTPARPRGETGREARHRGFGKWDVIEDGSVIASGITREEAERMVKEPEPAA